jgi:catechol-2,3-dioxygenase
MKTQLLFVNTLNQTIDFYTNQLGFSLEHVTDSSASLTLEGQSLELKLGQQGNQSLVFQTENIEVMEQLMLQHKIKFVRPPYRREEETETFNKVFDEFIVEDGEGNTITFSSFMHFKC